MIRFHQVVKILGGRAILDGVTFQIRKGEVFVIVGSSGAGKSVTLKHMVRLMNPDEGEVHVDDQPIRNLSGREIEEVRNRFGYLFQGGALLQWMSVAENVALPLREKTDMSESAIVDRVQQVLAMVGLEQDGEKAPSDISGGMKKRAGLARAIVRNPEIVLYDEPTSGLDPVTSRTIDDLIRKLQQDIGVTSVVVTHDLHSALSIGDRIAMLSQGAIAEISTPDQFLQSANPVVRGFLDSQFITREGPWMKENA